MKIEAVKALMLLPNLRPSNGVSTFAMNYFRRLDHDLIHIDFALYSDRETPYYDEIKSISNSKIYILENVKKINKHMKQCRRILLEGNYDVIHDNTLLISWPMMHEAQKMGIPVRILHSHNSVLGETRLKLIRNKTFLPLLKRTVNRYAACGDMAGRAMFGNESFSLIPNIIDEKSYVFDGLRREIIRKENGVEKKQVILTVGRTAEQKNPFFAIDIIEHLNRTYHDFEYWWIGSGPLDTRLKDYVELKGLKNVVRLFGSKNNIIDYYQAADAFFLPSKFEGLALVMIEAQAMGLPCVISDVITDEVIYTDLVKQCSLQKAPSDWALILKGVLCNKTNRFNYNKILKHSIYSSENAQETFLALYSY